MINALDKDYLDPCATRDSCQLIDALDLWSYLWSCTLIAHGNVTQKPVPVSESQTTKENFAHLIRWIFLSRPPAALFLSWAAACAEKTLSELDLKRILYKHVIYMSPAALQQTWFAFAGYFQYFTFLWSEYTVENNQQAVGGTSCYFVWPV